MERQVKVKIFGKEYHFLYSISVMFDATEKFGNSQEMFNAINGENEKRSVEPVIWLALKMAEAGELARRDAGHTPSDIPTEREFNLSLTPIDYELMKLAVVKAIEAGYQRSVVNNEEIDLTLLEIEEKKTEEKAPALNTRTPP